MRMITLVARTGVNGRTACRPTRRVCSPRRRRDGSGHRGTHPCATPRAKIRRSTPAFSRTGTSPRRAPMQAPAPHFPNGANERSVHVSGHAHRRHPTQRLPRERPATRRSRAGASLQVAEPGVAAPAWADTQLDVRAWRRIDRAMTTAIAELRREPQREPAPELRDVAGVPSSPQARRRIDGLVREVWTCAVESHREGDPFIIPLRSTAT